MRTARWLIPILILLTACSRATPTATESIVATPPPFPTFPPTYTATLNATQAAAPTFGATDIESTATPGATASAESTGAPTGPLVDRAEFVADVTVPDGADFGPGSKFTKTWRVKNVGTSTWTKEYVLEFVLGANMAAVNTVNFPNDVPPGGTMDISVEMTAPNTAGTHASLWQFRNPNGDKFGVGPNYNDVIYAQIDVVAGLSSGPTPAVTKAPTPSGPLNPAKVTKVTIGVDNASVSGSCPHTFVFTAILNIEGGGVVKYQLEASSTTEGFTFSLPAPIESTFTTNGPHTFGVSYTLEIRDTVQGQAWLHVLTPNDLVSDKVSFSLTCPIPPTLPPPATATATAAPSPTPTEAR